MLYTKNRWFSVFLIFLVKQKFMKLCRSGKKTKLLSNTTELHMGGVVEEYYLLQPDH